APAPPAPPAPSTPLVDQPKRITVVDVITKEYAAEGNYSNYFPLPPALPLSSKDDMASIKTIEEYLKQSKPNLRVSIDATNAPAFDRDQSRARTDPTKHHSCAFDDPSRNAPPPPPADAPLFLRNLHTRLLNFVELLYLHKEMVDKAEQNMLTEYFVCQRF